MRSFRATSAFPLLIALAASTCSAAARAEDACRAASAPLVKPGQRVVIAMIDGFGIDYLEQTPMPVMKGLMAKGFYKPVRGMTPSVTNVNNASICCGVWPSEHGVTGNSFFDGSKGRQAEYMESAEYLLSPTLFQLAGKRGVKSALLTCKKKTLGLLSRGTDVAVAAEEPPREFIRRYGAPPPIYSREINYWVWSVAVDLLNTRPDLGCIYVHTTDYPMHMWPPSAPESQEHLAKLDALIGQAVATAPDAAFLITADHGMNFKKRCWDLAKACRNRGLALRFALSTERDRYVKHHRTFGGSAWVWLNSPAEAARATTILKSLTGVESVATRAETAKRYHLKPERIGDLAVLGDKDTVFGETAEEVENLPAAFRTHGSQYETATPVVIFNASGATPLAAEIQFNFDITRTLYR